MSDLISSLSSNPYFSAGFGLVGVTSVLAVARKGSSAASKYLYRYYTSSIEINKNDKCYQWLIEWLSQNQDLKTSHKSVFTDFYQTETGQVLTKFIFPPAVGNHYFKYKGRYVFLERSRTNSSSSESKFGPTPFETINLKMIGRNTKIFEEILINARKHSLDINLGKTLTLIPDSISWRQFGHPRTHRPLESVVLDDGVIERITDDIKEFISSSEWYHERGIPHRRGYLLHGPPGCGKSSLISAVAGHLGYNMCVISLGEPGITDDRFQFLLNTAPLHSIIVLEDIDSAISNSSTNQAYRLTFSGLLNALDGVASSENRIIFVTTNNFDQLNKALIRPGRIDVMEEIGYASPNQIRRIFSRFYKDIDPYETENFLKKVLELNISLSPAQLQSYLLKYKNTPYKAIENIKDIINIQ